jgi:hypothetical protein
MANRDEVEEFLRRAAARRAAAQQQQRPAPQPAQPTWTPPPQQQPPPARRPPPLADVVMLQPVETVEAEVIDAELADQQDRLSRGVAQHLRGSTAIAAHAETLGDELELTDEKLDSRLHATFDHKVGDLKKSTMEAGAASPTQASRDAPLPGAASIAHLLLDPQNVRNAIILAEILRRPDENW